VLHFYDVSVLLFTSKRDKKRGELDIRKVVWISSFSKSS